MLLVSGDTFQIAKQIDNLPPLLTEYEAEKIDLLVRLTEIDVDAIQEARNYLKGVKVHPVLHIDNSREVWLAHSELGRVRICFDDVRYTSADANHSASEYELEIELIDGQEIFLEKVSQALSQQYGLIPNSHSKYERGVLLLAVFSI